MTSLNETIVGAMLFSLGGFAFAGGPGTDSSEGMMVANIAPLPPETAALAPEPRHFLHRFETTPQPPAPTASNEGPALFPFTPSVARIDDTVDSAYAVQPGYDVRRIAGFRHRWRRSPSCSGTTKIRSSARNRSAVCRSAQMTGSSRPARALRCSARTRRARPSTSDGASEHR